MKSLIQLLAIGMLLVLTSSAFGAEGVWVVSPDEGDEVNHKGFTIMAKTELGEVGLAERVLAVLFILHSSNGSSYHTIVYDDHTDASEHLEIITPKPSTLTQGASENVPHKFPIVAKFNGPAVEGDILTIQLSVHSTGGYSYQADLVEVTVR